jgi:hypothetical protein
MMDLPVANAQRRASFPGSATARRTARAAILLLCCAAAGCRGGDVTSPSPKPGDLPPGTPPTEPNHTLTVLLNGRVTESAPTALTPVAGATLAIKDGVNAGRTATASESGLYMFSGIRPGRFTVEVSAEGFVATSRTLSIENATESENFAMAPLPKTMSHVATGTLASGDGACSDGVSMKPCRIVAFPVHNPGQIDATLSWTPSETADLDVTLFRTGEPVPIARAAAGPGPKRVSGAATGGSTYELRITWSSGSGSVAYELSLTYPY